MNHDHDALVRILESADGFVVRVTTINGTAVQFDLPALKPDRQNPACEQWVPILAGEEFDQLASAYEAGEFRPRMNAGTFEEFEVAMAWRNALTTVGMIDEAIADADGPEVASLFTLLKEELATLRALIEGE